MEDKPKGFIISIVSQFLRGPLSLLFVASALILGAMSVLLTPREEEPQIVVPMVDITVSFPGHSPAEVEQLVTTPLERLLWQIPGVEHVYSTSYRDMALVIVRFHVGEDYTSSMVKIRDKMDENMHLVHQDVAGWQIDSVEIDDVPILSLTLFSPQRDSYELRRLAEEMKARLDSTKNLFQTAIIGGQSREILIEPDIEKLASRGLCLADIVNALRGNNSTATCGFTTLKGKDTRIITAYPLRNIADVKNTVVKAGAEGGLVRIEDIARVYDRPQEQENYTEIGFGPAFKDAKGEIASKTFPCVTMTFSKKKGTNSVTLAEEILRNVSELRNKVFSDDVQIVVTRNYGETANAKVNELLSSLAFAMITVVGLIAYTMGWREGLIVGLAVPVSFSLALFTNYVAGFTINRVTLFALILSLGMVVDDPITNVDNIQRHIRMGLTDPFNATLRAVQEVLPPVILSTIAIIISFTPMFFITGMMGPYMGPMAINVPLTVSFSTVCALTFVPWLAYNLLKKTAGAGAGTGTEQETTSPIIKKIYSIAMSPFFNKRNAVILLFLTFLAAVLSSALMLKVPLKMLPFDNKNELQILIDMPEGTALEDTFQTAQEIGKALSKYNEVKDYEIYAGSSSPIDFNGLVRHYYMRRMPHQADIRVNIVDKAIREQKSHSFALRIRDELTEIAIQKGAILSIVEVPPGPPVLSTLTVEIRGDETSDYSELIKGAEKMQNILRSTDPKNIAQIDSYAESPHDRFAFVVDKDKAAQHGLSVAEVTTALRTAIEGNKSAGSLHVGTERNPLDIRVRLPYQDRTSIKRLSKLWIKAPASRTGGLVQLSELGRFETQLEEQPIYHKNLERVVYVTAETVGRPPGEIIVQILWQFWKDSPVQFLKAAITGKWRHEISKGITAEWNGEGEWEITTRVFRDLGLAFGAALIGIFILLVAQTKNMIMPLVIMTAIPLTIIGIAPGFFLLNSLFGAESGGYYDPVFFTATGMIGMIALGGIVIRNSIVLIEFIEDSLKNGVPLKNAVLDSGAVRFRPIMLTALTTMLGSWPITLDPIFSGLAWALIFGLLASTFFTMLIVPTIYVLIYGKMEKIKT